MIEPHSRAARHAGAGSSSELSPAFLNPSTRCATSCGSNHFARRSRADW